MKKPDGFDERVVNDPRCWGLTEAQRERVATLLRQQHRKVVREVKLELIAAPQSIWGEGVNHCASSIVNVLNLMAKGGKGCGGARSKRSRS